MDIDQARTFLAIVAQGSFLEASKRLHVTQSTVSARILGLESELGVQLFIRNRGGASLTPEGRRFMPHAKNLVLTVEQAKHDVGLPNRYRASLRVGGRIALWDGFLSRWFGWMRQVMPDVAIRSEIGFEEDLMRRLIEGTLDLGLMYTPTHAPDLVVEQVFQEKLVLVSTVPDCQGPDDDYIYVDWGPGFYAKHVQSYPHIECPPQVVNIGWLAIQLIMENGGSCYLPARMAEPLIKQGKLYSVEGSPTYGHGVYAVYSRHTESRVLRSGLEGLRLFAERENQ